MDPGGHVHPDIYAQKDTCELRNLSEKGSDCEGKQPSRKSREPWDRKCVLHSTAQRERICGENDEGDRNEVGYMAARRREES